MPGRPAPLAGRLESKFPELVTIVDLDVSNAIMDGPVDNVVRKGWTVIPEEVIMMRRGLYRRL